MEREKYLLRAFFLTTPRWGYDKFISHTDLSFKTQKHIVNGVLAVTAKLTDDTAPVGTVAVPASSLASDILAALRSGKGADVTLVCGGEKIEAHSLVLSQRSSVFAAQLDRSSPLAVDLAAVPVPDSITPATLRRLLEFLYGDALVPESAEEARCPAQSSAQ